MYGARERGDAAGAWGSGGAIMSSLAELFAGPVRVVQSATRRIACGRGRLRSWRCLKRDSLNGLRPQTPPGAGLLASGRRSLNPPSPKPLPADLLTPPGRLHSRAAAKPPSRPGPAPRRRMAGYTCHGVPTARPVPVRVAIQEASSTTSISSRESLSKARHIATSSQESRGPCSAPVASSTMVYRDG